MGLEQLKYIREEGVDPHNVSFGHMDRNPDPWMHRKLAETGAYLCFDGIAKVKYNPESVRIKCILDLVKAGHRSRFWSAAYRAQELLLFLHLCHRPAIHHQDVGSAPD